MTLTRAYSSLAECNQPHIRLAFRAGLYLSILPPRSVVYARSSTVSRGTDSYAH